MLLVCDVGQNDGGGPRSWWLTSDENQRLTTSRSWLGAGNIEMMSLAIPSPDYRMAWQQIAIKNQQRLCVNDRERERVYNKRVSFRLS